MAITGSAVADRAGVQIYARYEARTAHIETIGTLYNGTQEVGSGSGLLLGDSFVLTNDHVIPPANNYRTLVVNVRLRSRALSPLQIVTVHRDETRDLALLELAPPILDAGDRTRCPMPVILDPRRAPIGSELYVLGFPVNQELAIANGLLSNQSGVRGRWLTNTLLNPGNSGGPAFDENSALVGIAVGGIVQFDTGGGNKVTVTGVNYIIPASAIVASPLYQKIAQIPVDRRCWTEDLLIASASTIRPASINTSSSLESLSGKPSAAPRLPDTLNRSFSVTETKDDHPVVLGSHSRKYARRFEAEPGYQITSCTLAAVSDNHASDLACNVQPGGSAVNFEFRLEMARR